jgi:hypothetical protein
MRRSLEILPYRFFLVNPRPAHLFMICSNIKLTGPAESIAIDALRIHEWNQRDLAMAVQRKLEIPEDANRARGIPRKALPFIVPGRPHLLDGTRLRKGSSRRPCNWDLGLDRRRHLREAIHLSPCRGMDCFRLRRSSYGGQVASRLRVRPEFRQSGSRNFW